MTLREAAFFVWEGLYKTAYRWGGDDPIEGFDCSGFVQEGLRAVGILPRTRDYTADALLNEAFRNYKRDTDPNRLRRGCLVFWTNPDKTVRHVEVVWQILADRVLTIGASGGGSRVTDAASAARANAYVRISKLGSDYHCSVDPFPSPF